MPKIEKVDASSKSFQNRLKSLPDEIRADAIEVIKDLLKDPMPKRIRFHRHEGYSRPTIFTVHVTRNHSHKLSLELRGTTAILRSIGTHKQIDRAP